MGAKTAVFVPCAWLAGCHQTQSGLGGGGQPPASPHWAFTLTRFFGQKNQPAFGIVSHGTQWRFKTSHEAIDPAQKYSLLVNDFIYARGDGHEMLAEFDPLAYNTAVDWRQPVIDWIMAQNSSAERPLDETIQVLTAGPSSVIGHP